MKIPFGRVRILIAQNDLTTLKRLLPYKSSINATSSDGTTPLMIATWYSRLEIIKWLLDEGADINARSYSGRTCFDCSNEKVYAFLKKYAVIKEIMK